MLSQVLPDTSIIPSYRASMSVSSLPRAKSAAIKQPIKIDFHRNEFNKSEFNSSSNRWPNKLQNDEDISPYHRRDSAKNRSYDIEEYSEDEDYYSGSSYQLQPKNAPSAYDVVRAKHTVERINELEKTNLNLRRMLHLYANNKADEQERLGSAKLLAHRESLSSKLGPPLLRQGRIGSTWRHIKQTNNYTNSNLLFIDGTVRINDSSRYPPSVYGYPPKNTSRQDELNSNSRELLGFNSQSLASLASMNMSADNYRTRPLNLSDYDNQYHNRAKKGFEYWTKDKREPENNRPKAKLYTTGAYKTFYGLGDSLLKT